MSELKTLNCPNCNEELAFLVEALEPDYQYTCACGQIISKDFILRPYYDKGFKLWRSFHIDVTKNLYSQLKWYEGIVFIDISKKEANVMILPFNVLVRWLLTIVKYIKIGILK